MIETIYMASQPLRPTFTQELALRRRVARSKHPLPARVFAVTSGKGGVGKTNVVANLAAALTAKKKRVMVIDADLGLGNLDLLLGVSPTSSLADFFAGTAGLDEIVIPNRHGILLLPGARGVQEITALRHEQKEALLTELDAMSHEMDLVLVDTGSGISDLVTYFTTAAQEIVVVVTPEPTSMTDAYALINVLASRHGQKRFWVLANNVAGEEEARRVFDTLSRTALRFLNASLDLLGWIPRDPQLIRAVARSRMVVSDASDSPSAKAFISLADRLDKIAAADVHVKSNLQFFFRRMVEGNKGEK
jgi:flagellar biosynthesis protein FlhG